jgi:galactokinase
MAALESIRDTLDGVAFRRARHVITENERVQAAVRAAEAGDAAAFGRLMDASHASLQGDFEVSSEALDQAVAAARAAPGCLGARMTGAGFGGCAVALVEADATDAFVTAAAAGYQRASGRAGSFLVATAADGAGTERDLTVR